MNKYLGRAVQAFEKYPVKIYMKVAIGAVGAPTLNSTQSKGIKAIARTGVGAYTISLGNAVAVDTYQRLMEAVPGFIGATSTTALGGMQIIADNSANAVPTIQVKFLDSSGVAVELGNGEIVIISLALSNTTAF